MPCDDLFLFALPPQAVLPRSPHPFPVYISAVWLFDLFCILCTVIRFRQRNILTPTRSFILNYVAKGTSHRERPHRLRRFRFRCLRVGTVRWYWIHWSEDTQ